MKKAIDCLIIGHNDVNFDKYVEDLKKMGIRSGAYRDLDLSFIRYNNRPYHATRMFNIVYNGEPIGDCESFSNTIAYLGTYLEKNGFTFDYIHSFQSQKEELKRKLQEEDIMAIAITTTLYVAVFPILEIVQLIKQYNKTARILIGGPFISTQCRVADYETLQYLFKSVDADIYVNSSQGENTLVHLLSAMKEKRSYETLHNIYFKNDDGYIATPLLKEDNILSENMVKWDLFSRRTGDYVNLRTSISCPFACAFCGFPEHAGTYQTAGVVEVEDELNRLKEIGVKSLHFIDDTLNVPQKRFKDLLRMMIKNRYNFKWHSQYRCQYADEETVALMKESGCEGVFLGIESGNNQILYNMNKKSTVEKYYHGVSLLKKYGILTYGSFIIGFPGETRQTVDDSVRFIEDSGLDYFRTQLWYCEPVTPIWKQREKFRIEGSHFEWAHSTMDNKEAADLVEQMFLSIKNALWLPQYGFDFDNLFHLSHRGLEWKQVGNFISSFNTGIREKLLNPYQQEVSQPTYERIKNAVLKDDDQFREYLASQSMTESTDIVEDTSHDDLDIDFDLD